MTNKKIFVFLFIALFLLFMAMEAGIRFIDARGGHLFFSNHRNAFGVPLTLRLPVRPFHPFRVFGPIFYWGHGEKTKISSTHKEFYDLKKSPGVSRIVCLGGSTTEIKMDGIHYPLKLQMLLRNYYGSDKIEVINVAYSGYSTAHSLLIFLQDVIRWEPDLVIVSHNINDLMAAYFPDFRFDYSHKYTHPYYQLPDYETNSRIWAEKYNLWNLLFQHSRFYWFLREKYAGISRQVTNHDLTEKYPLQRRSYGMMPPIEASTTFRNNLMHFVEVAKSRNIRILLASQPMHPNEKLFERCQGYKSYNDVVNYPLQNEFPAHHTHYNAIIEDVATKSGVLFLDSAKAVGQDYKYFIDTVHYSKIGIEKLAAIFSEFLIEENIIGSLSG